MRPRVSKLLGPGDETSTVVQVQQQNPLKIASHGGTTADDVQLMELEMSFFVLDFHQMRALLLILESCVECHTPPLYNPYPP